MQPEDPSNGAALSHTGESAHFCRTDTPSSSEFRGLGHSAVAAACEESPAGVLINCEICLETRQSRVAPSARHGAQLTQDSALSTPGDMIYTEDELCLFGA